MEKLRFMRGAAALLAGSAMLFASCSDDDAPMPDPELTLTPDTEISLPVGGGSVEVAVSTNLGSWTALSNETWCEVTLAEGKFTVSADANDALAARPTATVTVTAGEGERSITREVRVTQGAQTFTDLSAAGRANCYIVAPKSASVFDAAYKGNSSTESIGAAEGAELVWQSAQGLVTRVAYAADEKKIIVETADKSGNAVVAAVDESGTILWSWHLWIVDYDPSASLFTTAPNASGTTWSFMDRNLGARTVERGSFDSHGLLYQWGRKDPFPGTTAFTIMNEDYTYEVDGEPEVYDIDNRVLPKFGLTAEFHGTIEKSVQNPAVFYAMTYKHTGVEDEYGEEIVENDYKTGDWVDVSNDDYWGGESRKKTIYDPCPVGYKVPVCDADGNTPYAWLVYTAGKWDEANRGFEQEGQWFPTTGTRAYASGGLDYTEANPYSGLWIGTKGKASDNLELYPDLYGQYMFIIDSKRMLKVSKDKRSQGMSLRCVKE